MNKIQFMSELSRKLRRLPKDEFDDAMNYYNEYFLDAGLDDNTDVIPIVGTPEEVSKRILDECVDRQIEKVKTEGGVKNSSRAIWLVILGIFAAPIAFPVAIALFAVFFSLIVAAFAVLISLIVAGAAIALGGIGLIPIIFMADTFAQGLVILGVSLICLSLGILLCIGIFKLGELFVRGIANLFSHIGSKKKKEKTVNTVGGETL
ncbi:MAG: DUF1700 domain-containing protein [Eubacterium sp.]|nr:DUF1700 domain-containing protein [Eubacterium sp.]